MPNVPKLEKKRELLAPKSVGPLGKAALLGGIAFAGLGAVPSASALPTVPPGVQPAGMRTITRSAAPLVLQQNNVMLAQQQPPRHSSHISHGSHASHASHHSSS